MREYIDIVSKLLLEADKAPNKTKTKTAEPTSATFSLPPEDPGLANPITARTSGGQAPTRSMPGQTSRSAADVRMRAELPPEAGDMMGDFLSRQHAPDEISDEEAARLAGRSTAHAVDSPVDTPTVAPTTELATAENLPAVIRQEIYSHSDQKRVDNWEPNWTQVKHLPGYMANAIRAMGRSVFRQFTDTPLEDIQVMASPMVNSDYDLQRMAAFIARNGVKDDSAVMDFMQSIPGYQADVALYRIKDYEFLVVKDFAGKYIYGWPGGRGVHLDAPSRPQRRLR